MKVGKVSQKYKDMTDDELKAYIKEKLTMDPAWVRRALLALYDEQSDAEKEDPVNVHESNGMGFSPQDQEFLSSLARQALAGNVSFSQKQQGWLYTLLPKYAGQMVKIVRELQRMEPGFVYTIYYANVLINNNRREMEATTGELDLEARSMPEAILVRSPSGETTDLFKLHDVNVGPEGPQLFIYKTIHKSIERGVAKEAEWTLIISVADKEEMMSMEEAMTMMSGQAGIKLTRPKKDKKNG